MKKLMMAIKPVIALLLAVILVTQVYALALSGGTGGGKFLQYASAQSDTHIKEIEKVLKDLGMSVSPRDVPTSTHLAWEYGSYYSNAAKVPGDSGLGVVDIWGSEADASASFNQRAAASTQDSFGYSRDVGFVSMKPQRSDIGQNGVVWYNPGTGTYLTTGTNKVTFTGTATAVFVCGKVTLYGDQVRVGPILDMPADGIKGPEPLKSTPPLGENENYKNMKVEADKLSKQASDDLAQRLENIIGALSAKGLCTGVPQAQQPVDQTCPCTGENCPNQNLVPTEFQYLSESNIRPISYTLDGSNSYQKPDIVHVQASGAPTNPTRSGCLPIIFIPGVGGSELLEGTNILWPCKIEITTDPSSLLCNSTDPRDLPQLDLTKEGKPPKGTTITTGEVIRKAGGDVYDGLINSILRMEYDPATGEKYQLGKTFFLFPYDWRLDNSGHAEALDKLVNAIRVQTNKPKVMIITHSMGGLIATAYILSKAENAGKVDSLITIATPYFGAPKPFYAMTMGYNFDNPSVKSESFKISGQNWPSVYQLLPRFDFVKDQKTGKPVSNDDLYQNLKYRSLSRLPDGYIKGEYSWSANENLYPRVAKAFWNNLLPISGSIPSSIKHYVIVGTGVKTLTGFQMWHDIAGGFDTMRLKGDAVFFEPDPDNPEFGFGDGDGQVPLKWAIPKGATQSFYVPYIPKGTISENGKLNAEPISSVHGYLPGNKYVQYIVQKIISGKVSEAGSMKETKVESTKQSLSFNINPQTSDPNKLYDPSERVNFIIHSDVLTTIGDADTGEFMGYDQNGQIVESLPGTFLVMDDVEYASVGDLARNYKVSLKGIRNGNFTLGIDITKGNSEQPIQFSYLEVPVKDGTIAELTMTPNKVIPSSIPILKVNNDGKITDVAATLGPIGTGGNASTSTAGGTGGGTTGGAASGVGGVGTVQDGFLTYDNSEHGFKIRYPQDWKAEKGRGNYPDSPYTEVVKFSPSDSEYASVLLILDSDRDTPIPDLLADSVDEYNNHDTLKEVNVVESNSESLLSGKRAYELVFADSTNGVEHKNKEIGSSINGKAYYVSFFSEASNYEKYLPLVEQMFDSFELSPAGGGVSQTSPTGAGTTSTSTTTTSPVDTTNKTTTTTTALSGGGQQIDQSFLPVLLVHGWSSNSQDWVPWENLLQQDGIPYYPITFQESDDSCGTSLDHGNELGKKVEQIKQETGKDKVNIVGYSKGGLDARAYLAQSGTDDVSNLIMIGTPNAGTSAASLVEYCTPGLYDLRPGASATTVDRNPNVNYYTIAGDWNSNSGGNPLIEGADDQLVPVVSVESEQYFKSLGRTSSAHTELIGQEEYNLVRPILGGTDDGTKIDAGNETIVDTDPAEPPTGSTGQQQQQQQQPSSQSVLISDDFDSENNGKGELQYRAFMNWIPKEGTVDLIGNGFYDILGGKGLYVDLDGANLDAAILESKEEFSLSPGNYVLEFDISGSYFQGDANDVTVKLGNAFTETFTKEGVAPFEHIVRTIVVSQPTTAKLSFDHSGGDNIGLKLDNVKLYKSSGDVDTPKINADNETIVDTDPAEPPTSTPSPAKAAEMIDYENPDFRLAMKYPSNWAIEENPDYVVFTSPAENEADTSVESLYVYHLGDIPLGNSEEETLKSNIEATIDYRESYSDFQQLSSENIEFNGKTGGQLEYTYTDTNIGNTKAKEIIAIDGNDRYNILFIANADQYSTILPTAQEIIDSIQITPSQEQEDDGPTTTDQVINTTDDDGDDGGDGGGTGQTLSPPQEPLAMQPTAYTASVKLLPESSPHFFKCNETPTEGSPTLPGLDVESSARTAVTDGDPNTEMLGKAVFDITFDSPLSNGEGTEFEVFEIGPAGAPESFKVAAVRDDGTISNFKDYTAVATGSTDSCNYEISAIGIDLSDLGIGESDQASTIRIDNNGAPGCCSGADISDVLVLAEASLQDTSTESGEGVDENEQDVEEDE